MAELYDPLTYDNLMAGLALRFRQRPQQRLATVEEVEGPGVYALFYTGGFNAYRVISGGENPIYVGKAVPPGSRKGTGVDASKPALRSRLREHTRSIDAAENLEVAEFTYKHMAIEPVWITSPRDSSSNTTNQSGTSAWMDSAITIPAAAGAIASGVGGTRSTPAEAGLPT